MKITNVSAVYFSPTGTTQKIVLTIAKGTGIPFKNIDLTLPDSRREFRQSFGTDDLVIVGLPVYAGRLPLYLDDFFAGLEANCTAAAAVVSYGNREYNDALIELRIRLEDRGFRIRSAAAFIGQHTFSARIATGRPDAGDLSIAADFGKKTLSCIGTNAIWGNLRLEGNYPFKWQGFDPNSIPADYPPLPRLVTIEGCDECLSCIPNCPWQAIAPDRNRDYSKCMLCYRCMKNCPHDAVQVTGEAFLQMLPQFEAMCSRRRDPELFFPSLE
jgi:ferredoxin